MTTPLDAANPYDPSAASAGMKKVFDPSLFSDHWAGWVAGILLLLLAVVPFIAPWHYPPWYTYVAELLSAIFALGIAGALLWIPRPTKIGLSTWWFGGFAAAILLQTLIVQPGYWGPSLMAAAQLAICAFLTQAILAARARWGSDRILVVLTIALVIGGLVSGLIGWIQRLNITSHFPGLVLVHPVDPRQALGNIGQRNLYGHYLMWASISATYLFARFPRFWLPLFGLMTWMAFEAALAESRTTLGYYAFWLMVAVPAGLYKATPVQKRFALGSIWAVAVGLLMQFIGPDIVRHIADWFGQTIKARAGMDRFADHGGGLGRRVAEWQKALITFREHPLLGVGWGYFAGESFRLHSLPQFAVYREDVLWTHCHNSVLQIVAEMGLLGLGFLLALFALLVRAIKRWQRDITMVALPLLGVSLIHSQMEYPLWYLHYLALFAVFLALLEPVPEVKRVKSLSYRLPLWVFAVVLTLLHPLLFNWVVSPVPAKQQKQHVQWLKTMSHVPFFDYLAENAIVDDASGDLDQWPYLDGVTTRLMQYRPFPDANYWRMCTLGHTGRAAEVPAMLKHVEIAYPGYTAGFARDLAKYHCVPDGFNLGYVPPAKE